MGPLFEFFTEQFSLFDNPLYNFVTVAVLVLVADQVAFSRVGVLYRLRLISGRGSGSVLYWLLKFVMFAVFASVLACVIWVGRLVASIPRMVWVVLVLVGLGLVAYKQILKRRAS
jgi:hypothetical protein